MKKSRNRKLYIGLIWLELNKAPFDDLIALYSLYNIALT